ncbi:HD-GYP domain-containing protein [Wukongibacter sp. M2B1]|uniref:HD-GYP domain-containing protein n=1 Tax=Wukongibacter sp. M2B1 TaxID=3088895 RepID=UPI003D7B2757
MLNGLTQMINPSEAIVPQMDKLITLRSNACFYPSFLSTTNDFSMQTFLHSHNVAAIASKIAVALGLIEEEIETTYELALLHDIGKSNIPEEILFKPGKLTEEEFEVMKLHSIYSESIYLNIMKNSDKPGIRKKAKVIRHHHENYDGSGYPDGLKANEIPVLSRIITIADIFEAIIHPRVYRPHPVAQPMDVMYEMAGKKIDRNIFEYVYDVLNSYISD